MSEEQTPFGVTEEIALGDLTGLKEVKDVLPVASQVRFRIDKASIKDNSYEGSIPTKKYLNLQLRIVDGISFVDANGEAQTKFKNKVIFTSNKDLIVWVDTEHEFFQGERYKTGAYKIPVRQFLTAVGKDVKDAKFNDSELESLKGLEVLADIAQSAKRSKDASGNWSATGEVENMLRNWKQA
jgi:hypothetical protein